MLSALPIAFFLLDIVCKIGVAEASDNWLLIIIPFAQMFHHFCKLPVVCTAVIKLHNVCCCAVCYSKQHID